MARLKVLTANQIHDSELREMMQQTGDEMFGIYGHCPESFKAFLQFYRPLKLCTAGCTWHLAPPRCRQPPMSC